jgi:osmotically-inducible protein OsmY
MMRKTWAIAPTVLCLGLALAIPRFGAGREPNDPPPTSLAQQPKGTGEAIGDKVNDAVKSIKKGAKKTADAVRGEFEKARASIHDMSVQSRVYSRLHWDKNLVDSKIDIEVQGSVATLRGTAKTLMAKSKAITLARDTVGVDRVDDQLTIETAAPTPTGR